MYIKTQNTAILEMPGTNLFSPNKARASTSRDQTEGRSEPNCSC